MSRNQALQVALKEQSVIDIERTINEMKGNALATSNWEVLISSAPIAIRCLGACFMASNSKGTRDIMVPKVASAKIDRPPDLMTNLVKCSNLGTSAFMTANKEMGYINELSVQSENKVYDIIDLIGDRASAAKQLPYALKDLQQWSEECYQSASRIDQSFNDWLAFTQELWEACTSKSGQTSSEAEKALTEKAIATQKAKNTQSQVESTKATMEQLGKTLDAARSAFERSSKAQPTGWDLVGQELVRGIGGALIAGINSAMSKNSNDTQKPGNSAGQQDQNNVKGPSGSGNSSDPAYTFVKKDNYLYDLLKSMVKNAEGEVNWDLASGSGSANNGGNSGLSFVEAMLVDSKAAFSKQAGSGLATSTYARVLDDAIKIASEMEAARQKSKNDMNTPLPKKGNENVVRWQTLADTVFRDVHTLFLQSQSQPFSQQTPMGALPDPKLQAPKPDGGSSLGNSFVDAAAKNLETTAKTLESTNKIYGETSKLLSEQQSALMEINSSLTRLTSDIVRLDETKEILTRCIALIVTLKAQIVNLVEFFNTLSVVVKVVSNNLVTSWLGTVKRAVGIGGSEMVKVGQFSLESTERTMIMNGSVSIAAYFSFFADVAKAWREVSSTSIMPGIAIAESLSNPSGDASGKMARLDAWSNQSAENIQRVLGRQRQAIRDGMQERVEKVRDTLKQLPPPPPAVIELNNAILPQIENGEVKAVEQEFENAPPLILSPKRRSS